MGGSSATATRIDFDLFGTTTSARISYPLGKALRNVILTLLGLRYIDNF